MVFTFSRLTVENVASGRYTFSVARANAIVSRRGFVISRLEHALSEIRQSKIQLWGCGTYQKNPLMNRDPDSVGNLIRIPTKSDLFLYRVRNRSISGGEMLILIHRKHWYQCVWYWYLVSKTHPKLFPVRHPIRCWIVKTSRTHARDVGGAAPHQVRHALISL